MSPSIAESTKDVLNYDIQSVVPRPAAALASSESLLEMQNLKFKAEF